ncbi:MAG TPA: hypothetical protein VME69_13860 [Methylocella sp.]|nr:hypothetical protein [Methylocella sp.]
MSANTSRLAAALLLGTELLSNSPAFACGARPHAASLCALASDSVEIRGAPNGRVEYAASGKVLVSGHSANGLWARIEVPCIGYRGWIRRQDLACEARSASAQPPVQP